VDEMLPKAQLTLQKAGAYGFGQARRICLAELHLNVSVSSLNLPNCPQPDVKGELAGQLAISHSTISRKHLTITIDTVSDGFAQHLNSRSKLSIEDLGTKMGTIVNGQKIRGGKYVAAGADVEVTMGKCPSKFRYGCLMPSSVVMILMVIKHHLGSCCIHFLLHK
jgi:nucleoid DNA-binding protein